MKTINIDTQENVELVLFPDNSTHVKVKILSGEDVRVIVSLCLPQRLMQLMQVANAVKHTGANCSELFITYLAGARYDRIIEHGDSIDTEVMAACINQCGFDKVFVFDPHSKAAVKDILNYEEVGIEILLDKLNVSDFDIMLFPDKGAYERYGSVLERYLLQADVVWCTKTRDSVTHKPVVIVPNPEQFIKDKRVLIIDDICDGGGTFASIADQIDAANISLVVSHGIFSSGLRPLDKIDLIVTTNSYMGFSTDSLQVMRYDIAHLFNQRRDSQCP